MTFTVIDWICAIIILIFALVGLIKGFVNNVMGKLAVILGILLACMFYGNIGELFLKSINNPALRNIVAFVLIFVVVFLVIKLIQIVISKVFEWNILKSLDRTLGFFFGAVEGLAIVSLLLLLLSIQPFYPMEELFEGSFFYSLLGTILTHAPEGITKDV
ncbi:MAG: CvpA family protein [Treponema sp.]|nr:CvpA family protein [Treponema sp.]